MPQKEDKRCQECGERLKPNRIVWLELNWLTGRYSKPGEVPERESQGCFPFGRACATKKLKADIDN